MDLYRARDWPRFAEEVAEAGEGLKRAGAVALMIGSNTTHRAAATLGAATGIRIVHLLDVLAQELTNKAVKRPLLIGTLFTMAGDFYIPALAERYSGDIVTPCEADQSVIERIIVDELCAGTVRDESRRALLEIIAAHDDVDAVVLACTELCLILSQEHIRIPVFDTTALHAEAGLRFAFGEDA